MGDRARGHNVSTAESRQLTLVGEAVVGRGGDSGERRALGEGIFDRIGGGSAGVERWTRDGEDEIEARSARLAGSGSAVGRTMEPSDVRRGRGDVRRSGTTKEKK